MIDPTTIDVLAVLFVASLIRSSLGFGEALVAVPLLALRLPVKVATPLAVGASVVVASVIVAQDWRRIEFRAAIGLVISGLLGIPLGIFILMHGNERPIKIILGLLLAGFSIYCLTARTRLHLKKDHPLGLLAVGFLSGVLGGAYGMNGPPLAIYGSLRRWSPQKFRATLQCYFLPASLTGIIGYASAGLCSGPVPRYFLFSLPGIIVAIIIGRYLNHRLRGDSFFKYVYLGLIAIGCALLFQAFSSR